jgi:hypothetical protein
VALAFGAPAEADLSLCKSRDDSLFYQAGRLFFASEPLIFRRSVA